MPMELHTHISIQFTANFHLKTLSLTYAHTQATYCMPIACLHKNTEDLILRTMQTNIKKKPIEYY